MKIGGWIAEAAECDFKVALETKNQGTPKARSKASAHLPMGLVGQERRDSWCIRQNCRDLRLGFFLTPRMAAAAKDIKTGLVGR